MIIASVFLIISEFESLPVFCTFDFSYFCPILFFSYCVCVCMCVCVCVCVFSFWQHMKFSGQGSDLSCSCNLSHSCGNTGFLTHCARPGIELSSQRSQDATDPTAPQWELPLSFMYFRLQSSSL